MPTRPAATPFDRLCMARAVEVAAKSIPEPDRERPAPKVGAVLARPDQILGEAYRGQTGSGDHAEFALLSTVGDIDVSGATLYATLEPCSTRATKKPCALRVIERGIARVFIGSYDTNPKIYRAGWKILDEAGVELRDFPSDLREAIRDQNVRFLSEFLVGRGDTGSATFDYTLNGGRFEIVTDRAGTFRTRWSSASGQSIHLYSGDPRYNVAGARHARAFEKIDDPDAYDFGNHAATIDEGGLGIVPNDRGFLLIRVTDVFNAKHGDDRYQVDIEWEARSIDQATTSSDIRRR